MTALDLFQVVGCIVEHKGKLLLCKRAIDPCKGKWTLPAGFMELHESSMGMSLIHKDSTVISCSHAGPSLLGFI